MNREQWLMSTGSHLLNTVFADNGYTAPGQWRVTCGWPSRGAISTKQKTIGQCFTPAQSGGGVSELVVSMALDDPIEVLAVLAHELAHFVVGCEHGHRAPFKRCALAIGLEGKMTATVPGEKFREMAKGIVDKFGAYPHAKLDVSSRKKQSTRLLKCQCSECGYTVRVTAKWVELGTPICPLDHIPMDIV